MKRISRFLAVLLAAALLSGVCLPALAAEDLCTPTAQALVRMVFAPGVGTSGGEWSVFALARWGGKLPQGWADGYLQRLTELLEQNDGVLHKRKYTEYSRVVIALTALGCDPRDFAGYDLVAPLGDFEKVIYQGVNGAVYALLALNSGRYDLPGMRTKYVDYLLSKELPGGGFALAGSMADPDITAMVLQALAPYCGRADVAAAVERALGCLSRIQQADGGYSAWGGKGSESTAQVLVALCELGIALDDTRFVKNGVTLLDNLLSYRLPDGSFSHVVGGKADLMATEQGLYALVAVQCVQNGQLPIFRMTLPALSDAADIVRLSYAAVCALLGR